MNVFDIIGPVMVGPSSPHTAGAVRIGLIARKLLGEEVQSAQIGLYGSFLETGKGHGTRQAIVAGLMGMTPDDMSIPDSIRIAEENYPTLVVRNLDQSGHVSEVTSKLAHKFVNIATMQLYRANRGGNTIQKWEINNEIQTEVVTIIPFVVIKGQERVH